MAPEVVNGLFIGFAGNLVVGVWVGRDDDTSLGKVSGGTVPAEVWRSFMTSALAIDDDRGPVLPAPRRPSSDSSLKSPLPPEWSNSTKRLREIARQFRTFAGG
jgi:penicillin-binding protein 1A